jgi:hypothetical protein
MENKNINIDFTKEPYKSMVDPKDPEFSKRIIKFLVGKVGEPDNKGNFKITKERFYELTQEYLAKMN